MDNSTNRVNTQDRFTRHNPCPICGGYRELRQGKGIRCAGYYSPDWQWANCTREEHAGNLQPHENGFSLVSFGHKCYGPCPCGNENHVGPATDKSQRPNGPNGRKNEYTFPYCAADGSLLFYGRRSGDGDDKRTWVERPNPQSGKPIPNLHGITLVPYRLNELVKYPNAPVYIAEGERKVDALRQWGLIATCNVYGAGKWEPAYSEHLRGRQVYILPDNDKPGAHHAQDVAQKLAGIAASIKIVRLPNLPHKGDILDYIADGGTKEALLALLEQAEEWIPDEEDEAEAAEEPRQQQKKGPLDYRPLYQSLPFISAADLEKKTFPALRSPLPGILTEGFTILAAGTKNGKSCWSLQGAKAIAMNGIAFGWLKTDSAPCEVLYVYLEENEQGIQEHQRMMREDDTPAPPNLT